MAIIKIQFNKQIRKFNDSQNIQLNKIYNFIMKHFDNLPPYFELQFRDPLNKIKRQLMNNEQLQNLIQMKQNITLIIKPIIFENISRYQISKKKNEQFQSTGIFSDMALLLERLSLHQTYSEGQFEKENNNNNTVVNNCSKNIINKFLVEDCSEQENIKKEECFQLAPGVNNNYYQNIVIQDEKDFLIKDETREYVDQMFCISSDDDSSEQIELNF
ncbi:hypothetical protein ABPG74_008685 [Tetrahymena malaccensis]